MLECTDSSDPTDLEVRRQAAGVEIIEGVELMKFCHKFTAESTEDTEFSLAEGFSALSLSLR